MPRSCEISTAGQLVDDFAVVEHTLGHSRASSACRRAVDVGELYEVDDWGTHGGLCLWF